MASCLLAWCYPVTEPTYVSVWPPASPKITPSPPLASRTNQKPHTGATVWTSGITRDTFRTVASVTVRDLRNHGREVIDRVLGGERLTVTRSGRPVAELHPLAPRGLNAATLLKRWQRLPAVDTAQFRRDLDEVLDSAHGSRCH